MVLQNTYDFGASTFFLTQEHKHPAQCINASFAFLNISHIRIQ